MVEQRDAEVARLVRFPFCERNVERGILIETRDDVPLMASCPFPVAVTVSWCRSSCLISSFCATGLSADEVAQRADTTV